MSLPRRYARTVLVIDDDPVSLEVSRERLESAGYRVVGRERSLGSTQWIVENRPDFVLLDVVMPALSGGELARMLAERAPSVGVILYSSKAREELDRIVEESGALGGLSKDLGDTAFVREFARLVRSAAPRATGTA